MENHGQQGQQNTPPSTNPTNPTTNATTSTNPEKKQTKDDGTMTTATVQPINQGYVVRGIVVPHDSRQVIFNDDLLVDIAQPTSGPIIITNPTQSTTSVPIIATSMHSQLLYCPVCKKTVLSSVRTETSYGAFCCWLLFMILLFPFSLLCLCFMPFPYELAVHTCPTCGTNLGTVGGLF